MSNVLASIFLPAAFALRVTARGKECCVRIGKANSQ
jgi:hypothetical protein